MIHSALLVTLGVVITAFMSFWSVVFSFFPDADNKIHTVANLWAKFLLLICNIKVKVFGEKIFCVENRKFLWPIIKVISIF